jgi:hypothetical protein
MHGLFYRPPIGLVPDFSEDDVQQIFLTFGPTEIGERSHHHHHHHRMANPLTSCSPALMIFSAITGPWLYEQVSSSSAAVQESQQRDRMCRGTGSGGKSPSQLFLSMPYSLYCSHDN